MEIHVMEKNPKKQSRDRTSNIPKKKMETSCREVKKTNDKNGIEQARAAAGMEVVIPRQIRAIRLGSNRTETKKSKV